jgi:hypothetical protein
MTTRSCSSTTDARAEAYAEEAADPTRQGGLRERSVALDLGSPTLSAIGDFARKDVPQPRSAYVRLVGSISKRPGQREPAGSPHMTYSTRDGAPRGAVSRNEPVPGLHPETSIAQASRPPGVGSGWAP